MYGLDPEQSIRQLVRCIADFELTDFVDELTETYSHGMRQRLTFAAALLHEPAVLVIDEPMVGLDPRSARVVKDLLQAKAREGMTIFMSTHLLSVAEEIAHRVAIVDQGRLRFLGTVDQLRKELPLTHTSLEHLYLSLTATPGRDSRSDRLGGADRQIRTASPGTLWQSLILSSSSSAGPIMPGTKAADTSTALEARVRWSNPLSLEGEARAFWRLRWRMITPYARPVVVDGAAAGVAGGFSERLFLGRTVRCCFSKHFDFMNNSIGHTATYAIIVQTIYSVFFASLMVMLVLSAGIIVYSGLYCSAEAAFLLTTPIRPERIVQHKFQEAIAFSSWGFLLLGTPMLVAYGVESEAHWYYFVLLLPFMLTFVYIPGSLGAILCLVLVYRMPRLRQQWLVAIGVTVVIGLFVAAWSSLSGGENDLLTPPWFLRSPVAVAVQSTSPAAKLVAEFRSAGGRQQGLAEAGLSALLGPEPALFVPAGVQCFVGPSADDVDRGAALPGRLQCAAHPTHGAQAAQAILARQNAAAIDAVSRSSHALFDSEGPARLSSRSGPVVSVSDLLRPADAVLRQHPPIQLRGELHRLGQHDQLPQSGGGRTDSCRPSPPASSFR